MRLGRSGQAMTKPTTALSALGRGSLVAPERVPHFSRMTQVSAFHYFKTLPDIIHLAGKFFFR